MRQWLFGIGSVKIGAEEGLSSSAEVLLLLVPRGAQAQCTAPPALLLPSWGAVRATGSRDRAALYL